MPPKKLKEEVASRKVDNCVTVKQLLLGPYQKGSLKEEVVHLLTSPNLYLCAHGTIIPNEQLGGDNTFWPLIYSLAKRGIYVMEEDESVVDHSVLEQRDPFNQVGFQCETIIYAYNIVLFKIERSLGSVRCSHDSLCFQYCYY